MSRQRPRQTRSAARQIHPPPSFSGTIHYVAPPQIGNEVEDVTQSCSGSRDDCPICFSRLANDTVALDKCGHVFHKSCLKQWFNMSSNCPNCDAQCREPQGTSPSGSMTTTSVPTLTCGGFGPGTLRIQYNLKRGTQAPYHPNPGASYGSTNRVAFLPDNPQGQELLARLQYAFTHGLSFTVGTSLTTRATNVITWSSVPHKTSLNGGAFGFPDSHYFAFCNGELDRLHVPTAAALMGQASVPLPSAPPAPPRQDTSPPTKAPQSKRTKRTPRFSGGKQIIRYDAPAQIGGGVESLARACEGSPDDCPICLSPLSTGALTLDKCGHMFHKKCLEEWFKMSSTCPNCKALCREPQGKSPSGTMTTTSVPSLTCGGYSPGTLQIQYTLSGGIQAPYHPNPGTRYGSESRVAYLPDNTQGQELLGRLQYAFTHGLSFTVGTSLTTGANNVITWSSVHHKTSCNGGVHGFPDPNYFDNCHKELDGLGVPSVKDLGYWNDSAIAFIHRAL